MSIFAFMQVRFFTRVLEMALYAYTMYGVGITPAVLAAFLWKRANACGGVSSIAAGMSVTILWEIIGNPFNMPTIYPALFSSLFCLVVVSLIKKRPHEERLRPFYIKTSNEASKA